MYPCHWLQPVVDDELASAELIRRKIPPSKDGAQKFVSGCGLKPIAWLGKSVADNICSKEQSLNLLRTPLMSASPPCVGLWTVFAGELSERRFRAAKKILAEQTQRPVSSLSAVG
ncbi:MAG: hypothetical protein N2116_00840 [Armatimonadetes bacterium]|nr:hypothetical protein [Armatimonadota bacterium]